MAGIINSVKTTLTVTNGAYTIADVVGGLITLPYAVRANGGAAMIRSIKLGGVVAISYNLWFFNADLASTLLDNAAMVIVAADENKYLGHVVIATADYVAAQAAFNVATVRNVGLMVQAAAGTRNIYAYMEAVAVTSPGTTTLYLTVDFEPL